MVAKMVVRSLPTMAEHLLKDLPISLHHGVVPIQD